MKNIITHKHSSWFSGALMAGICTLVSVSAFADKAPSDWNFTCYPESTSEVVSSPPPKILIVLDKSGSMSYTDSQYGRTRWDRATSAIESLVRENRDQVSRGLVPSAYYGLGLYSGSAEFPVDCTINSANSILYKLNQSRPGGGTATDKAINGAMRSSCHKNLLPGQKSATLLITDGAPNNRNTAIKQTCDHIHTAPVYVVGLGRGTDEEFNNGQAAAGGTGGCYRNGVEEKPENNISPCISHNVYTRSGYHCNGALSTQDESGLRKAIENITNQISCTFSLDRLGVDGNSVPEDPTNQYPYVRISYTMREDSHESIHSIPYRHSIVGNQTHPGWTWTFADGTRSSITLGSEACSAIRQTKKTRTIKSVSTQVGCICTKPLGANCQSKDWESQGICPEGVWQCNQGIDACLPKNGKLSKTYACTVPGAIGHCAAGNYSCRTDGTLLCDPLAGPMPEICNGLDDDCDGVIDNITESWSQPQFEHGLQQLQSSDPSLYTRATTVACTVNDTCVCPTGGAATQSMPDGTFFPHSMQSYVDGWSNRHGSCTCSPL